MEPRAREIEPAGPGAERAAETVTLPYEDRFLRRRRLTADSGLAFLLDLAEAHELPDGGALVLEDGRRIRIRAASEPLAEARASGAALARLAWHVGNRHTPAQLEDGRLLIQRDHVLEDMLARLGATVTHVDAQFTPEGGAYGEGRTHGHSHSHDPQEDPNAHIERRRDHSHHHHHDHHGHD